MDSLNIAIDYDETYTRDPLMWDAIIAMMLSFGHNPMVVTFRDLSLPLAHTFKIPVYYTSYKAKRDYMLDIGGVNIDIWIDDSPDTIVADSRWTEEDREKWKEEKYDERISEEVAESQQR